MLSFANQSDLGTYILYLYVITENAVLTFYNPAHSLNECIIWQFDNGDVWSSDSPLCTVAGLHVVQPLAQSEPSVTAASLCGLRYDSTANIACL